MALLVLDPASSTPPYEQVRSQIAAAIGDGTLGPQTQLPTVRRLARELGLAVNTVARAYRELELAGLVETRGRQGTFVAGAESQARQLAAQGARDFLQAMADLGFSADAAIAIARREAGSAADPAADTRRQTPGVTPGRTAQA